MRKLGTELSEGVGTAETASEGDSVGSEDSAGVGAAVTFSSALAAEIAVNSATAKRVRTFMILFYGIRSKV